jgi:hypothetical protein
MTTPDTTTPEDLIEENGAATATEVVETEPAAPAATPEAKAETEAPAPDTAAEAPAAEISEPAAVPAQTAETETAVVETAPDAEAPVAETETAVAATEVAAPAAVAVPAAAGTGESQEEDPQTAVFSLVTFFLAALPVIGVILNSIAVARAGKEGFDLWLARWGLALAIIETVGALALVGLGYYLGLLTAGAV